MKTYQWILIIFGGIVFILGFMLIVPVIILGKSWWWFFGTFIVIFFVGIIIGSIILITKLRKKKPLKLKMDVASAKKRAIYEMKYDEDNPDNFQIKNSTLLRIGEKGAEKTPILHLKGIGTELQETRHAIINLNNPKKEISTLINPTEEQVKEAINKMAEHPPEEEIKEERIMGVDEFGRPLTTIRTRKPSSTEKEIEKEKQEAEKMGGI